MKEVTAKEAEMYGEEMEAQQEAAKDMDSYATCKLQTPLTVRGETFDALEFDTTGLTGADILQIETDLRKKGVRILLPQTSKKFGDKIAQKCCVTATKDGSPVLTELIQKDMCARDYMMVQRTALALLFHPSKSHKDDEGYTQELISPVTIRGKQVESLTFCPDKLKGSDIQTIMDHINGTGFDHSTMQEFVTLQFQAEAAARCCYVDGSRFRMTPNDLAKLQFMDFLAICSEIRSFFTF